MSITFDLAETKTANELDDYYYLLSYQDNIVCFVKMHKHVGLIYEKVVLMCLYNKKSTKVIIIIIIKI